MNKKMRLLTLACMAIIPFNRGIVTAQDSLKNALGISFGGCNFHILDVHASELIYKGTGIAPSIEYDRQNRKNFHILKGSFYYDNLSSSSDNYKSIKIAGQMRYGYFRSLIVRNFSDHQFNFSAGMSLSAMFMKSDYKFYLHTDWARVIKSWYGSYSADFACQFNYKWHERNKINILFFMPVISNVSRPKYSSSGDFNYEKNDWQVKAFGNTMMIPENFVVSTHFSYERYLSVKFSMKAEYEFYYTKCENPDLIKFYMNNVRIGISYKF
jgi:hypothetical protein